MRCYENYENIKIMNVKIKYHGKNIFKKLLQ